MFYCEGFAVPPDLFPIEHAWLVDSNGCVIDPTWKDGTDYFGVVLRKDFVLNHMLKTKKYGILCNLHHLSKGESYAFKYLEGGILEII